MQVHLSLENECRQLQKLHVGGGVRTITRRLCVPFVKPDGRFAVSGENIAAPAPWRECKGRCNRAGSSELVLKKKSIENEADGRTGNNTCKMERRRGGTDIGPIKRLNALI